MPVRRLAPLAERAVRRRRPAIMRLATRGEFDAVFYGSFYQDLAGLSASALYRHLKHHGLREGRFQNSRLLLEWLQATHGRLPPDFSAERYRSANPHLRDQLAYSWQPAMHYLTEGQHQASSAEQDTSSAGAAQSADLLGEGLDRPATAEDIQTSFSLLHGRVAEAQVVRERTGQPLRLVVAGAISSDEFATMVVRPVTESRPPHAALSLPPSTEDDAPFLRDLGLPAAKLRKAKSPAEVLRVLYAAPSLLAVIQAYYPPERLAEFEAGLRDVCEALESERLPQGEAPPGPPAVVRARMLRLEMSLADIFGAERLTTNLLGQVAKAVRQVERSDTVLAGQLGPVLIARYMLTRHPNRRLDYGRMATQVAVVAEVCFGQEDDLDSPALQTRILNRVRRFAIATPLSTPITGAPPFTVAMACAAHLRHGVLRTSWTDESTVAALHEFFDENVDRCGFETYLTPAQRAFMQARRATMEGATTSGGAAHVGALQPTSYELVDGALQTLQVQVTKAGVPPFLVTPGSAAASVATMARDRLQVEPWGRGDLAPSTSGPAGSLHARPASKSHRQGRGRKLVRSGDRVTFNEAGEGRRYLLGNGWWQSEATHTWSGRHAALLAFHFAPEDVRPLDLHLRFMAGPHTEGLLKLYWNSALVGQLRPEPSCVQSAQVHLGQEHRSGPQANILCLEIDELFSSASDPRRLGVALCHLTFVAR